MSRTLIIQDIRKHVYIYIFFKNHQHFCASTVHEHVHIHYHMHIVILRVVSLGLHLGPLDFICICKLTSSHEVLPHGFHGHVKETKSKDMKKPGSTSRRPQLQVDKINHMARHGLDQNIKALLENIQDTPGSRWLRMAPDGSGWPCHSGWAVSNPVAMSADLGHFRFLLQLIHDWMILNGHFDHVSALWPVMHFYMIEKYWEP